MVSIIRKYLLFILIALFFLPFLPYFLNNIKILSLNLSLIDLLIESEDMKESNESLCISHHECKETGGLRCEFHSHFLRVDEL